LYAGKALFGGDLIMAIYQSSSGTWADSPSATVGPITEGAAGIAVIVLAILGLAAISSAVLTSVATIIVGVGLLIEAANTGVEYAKVSRQAGTMQIAELGADVSIELMVGLAGIVLGVLALLSTGSVMTLLPAALIAFGGALLLAGFSATTIGTVQNLETVAGERTITMQSELAPARGIQVLIGIAAIVLGILALVLSAGGTLLMVGLLVVGGALLATSANFTQSFIRMLSR
jgi:hypothetical protein